MSNNTLPPDFLADDMADDMGDVTGRSDGALGALLHSIIAFVILLLTDPVKKVAGALINRVGQGSGPRHSLIDVLQQPNGTGLRRTGAVAFAYACRNRCLARDCTLPICGEEPRHHAAEE